MIEHSSDSPALVAGSAMGGMLGLEVRVAVGTVVAAAVARVMGVPI